MTDVDVIVNEKEQFVRKSGVLEYFSAPGDFGQVGGLAGSSEQNIRRTIQFAEAVAPCILWIDEIEKDFSGVRSVGDSGASSRVFSTFRTWMQEKTSPVFVFATANDVSALPPELLRKGRFDELFFVDLPFPDERRKILDIHLRTRGRDPDALGIDVAALAASAEGFSGAELEQAVIDGLYHAVDQGTEIGTAAIAAAIRDTYPLSEMMREWAEKRARYASTLWRNTQGETRTTQRWAHIGN